MSLVCWLPLDGTGRNLGIKQFLIKEYIYTENKGKTGKCAEFDSSSRRVELGTTLANYFNGDPFSICFWIKSLEDGTRGVIFGGYGLPSTTNAFNLEINDGTGTTNYIRFWWAGTIYTSNPDYVTYNEWVHLAIVYTGTQILMYKNGVLTKTHTATLPAIPTGNSYQIGRDSRTNETVFTGYMNDFRFYDHALSAEEVKEISMGLIYHYKLDSNIIQTMNNCFNYPTFNTSDDNGGWSHWGNTGHLGTYGQNTDRQYIYRKDQTYSHWIQNDAGASVSYLMHQSPAFEGGFRSLCCILKESNSLPINESIIFPTWNGNVSDGLTRNTWSSVQSLGDGFYLCKSEGIKQDGTNDLVGLYVRASYRVYVSECYLENDRTICSDIFYSENRIVDSSGYGNHAEYYTYDSTGSVECSKDSPRNGISTFVNAGNPTESSRDGQAYIFNYNKNMEYCNLICLSVAFWCKPITGYDGKINRGQFNFIFTSSDGAFIHKPFGDYDCITINCISNGSESAPSRELYDHDNPIFIDNEWHHYVITFNGVSKYAYVYRDGQEILDGQITAVPSSYPDQNRYLKSWNYIYLGTGSNTRYKNQSYYSDFRVYCTALSAEDIKSLYQASEKIDKNGNLYAYEFKEQENLVPTFDKDGTIIANTLYDNAYLNDKANIGKRISPNILSGMIDVVATKDGKSKNVNTLGSISAATMTSMAGKVLCLSYDVCCPGDRSSTEQGQTGYQYVRFGVHGGYNVLKSDGTVKSTTYPFANQLEYSGGKKRISQYATLPTLSNGETLSALTFNNQTFDKPATTNNSTWYLRNIKLEICENGSKPTPYIENGAISTQVVGWATGTELKEI